MRTIEEAIMELRKDIHSDTYLGKKTIGTYLDEILEIHKAEQTKRIPQNEDKNTPQVLFSYAFNYKNGDQCWADSYEYTVVNGTDIQLTAIDGYTGDKVSKIVTEDELMRMVNKIETASKDDSHYEIYRNVFCRPSVSSFMNQDKIREREDKIREKIEQHECISIDSNDDAYGQTIRDFQIIPDNKVTHEYYMVLASIHSWSITTDSYGADIGAFDDYHSTDYKTYLLDKDFDIVYTDTSYHHDIDAFIRQYAEYLEQGQEQEIDL